MKDDGDQRNTKLRWSQAKKKIHMSTAFLLLFSSYSRSELKSSMISLFHRPHHRGCYTKTILPHPTTQSPTKLPHSFFTLRGRPKSRRAFELRTARSHHMMDMHASDQRNIRRNVMHRASAARAAAKQLARRPRALRGAGEAARWGIPFGRRCCRESSCVRRFFCSWPLVLE